MVQSINKNADECLIFFNPMSSDSRFWTTNIPRELLERFEVIFYEYPGYNRPFIKLENFKELARFIDKEVLENIHKPIHLVGYSYGGLLVQHLLNLNRHNIKSAVLIACANRILARDKELLSVLKKVSDVDMYLFCRVLSLFSHGYEDFNKNPLIGLQKFSNLKLSIPDKVPIIQQMNHIIRTARIEIQKQPTRTMLIYGSEDRMIDMDTLDSLHEYLENLSFKKLTGEAHIIDPAKMFHHIHQFLKEEEYAI
ncbi:alpha/beta hydrolase [Chitinophaga sp.]|uniref:alpha/beta fold hydrolase n=1 Tax=Chitinophaga sp. TaxID=1869181 RepID=UPI0031D31F27